MKHSILSDQNFSSSFISCEKDLESILKKIFVSSYPYSDYLKRLLVINTKDCLDLDNFEYQRAIDAKSIADLKKEGYFKIEPKIEFGEHEEVKSRLLIEFTSFTPNTTNPEYRDCVVDITILCHTDYWDLGDYKLRPIKIMGYIEGILNKSKLSGIGTLQFLGANEVVLDEDLSGYLLRYAAIHGSDDQETLERSL